MGKTTLLWALQGQKFDKTRNLSTNGVDITKVTLTRNQSFFSKKLESVVCNMWDFGGQTVFHSTHRFFITPYSLYMVLYDMRLPDTLERAKYAMLFVLNYLLIIVLGIGLSK